MENRGIGIRLRMLNNAVRRYIDRNSEIKSEMENIKNITCSNGWIIGHLCEMESIGKDVYQRDFENDFGITRSTASKVLSLLEKKELIERVSASHDGRMKKIVLTEKSRQIGRDIGKEAEQMEEQLKKGFSEEELQTLYSYLDRIQENLDNSYTNDIEKRRGKN